MTLSFLLAAWRSQQHCWNPCIGVGEEEIDSFHTEVISSALMW